MESPVKYYLFLGESGDHVLIISSKDYQNSFVNEE